MYQFDKIDQSLSWQVERRIEFIEFRLFWEGRINRSDLTDFFDISIPQASSDLGKYQSIAPNNIEYDKSGKFYYAASTFKPAVINPSTEEYFHYLIKASDANHISFLGHVPQHDFVPLPGRKIDPYILRTILSAIRNKNSVNINYQSMSRPEPINRWISPHALGYDGFRWHIRAHCGIHQSFRDFIFGRILKINDEKTSDIDPQDDASWHNYITLRIGPHPNLDAGPRRTIEYDYGMENGQASLSVRIALAFYLLKRLGLIGETGKSPPEQQIVLLNRDEVFNSMQH